MPIEIVVPQIGEAVAELTLTTWLKAAGDAVKKGEVLFEIDSDKAIVEVEAFVAGTLVEILVPDGSAVMPQQVVARLQPDGESAEPAIEAPATKEQPITKPPAGPKITPVAQRLAADLGVNLALVNGSGPGGRITADDVRQSANHRDTQPTRINASPKARNRARELQVDLTTITGTGVGGLIRVKDVEQFAPVMVADEVLPAMPGIAEPLSKLRQTIANRTTQSKQTVPHFYLLADVNMSQVNNLRTYCRETLGWAKAPTYTDVLVRASALALRHLPEVNRHYTAAGLVNHDGVNIGVAIHTKGGLVAPVIVDADRLDLQATSQALRDLAGRAREGRLKAADTGQKSLVISNLGMYSVDAFVAIIDMPDPMILAVGQVADRVVAVNGQPLVQPMCTLTLSVDHRALDGVPAARFLEQIKQQLENPFEILNTHAH